MKNFLGLPLSNGIAILAVVALAAALLLGGGGGSDVTGLALGGSATNFTTLQVGDGSVTTPSLGFTSDTNNGLYRIGADNVGLSAGGTKVLDATASGVTLVGGVTLDAASIDSTEIANITRTVNLPLMVFIECTTDGGATINYTDGADAFPDFINSSTNGLGFVLAFDATTADTAFVCAQLSVPQDYASGGAITVEATKGAETGANSEVINCAGSINGAALGTAGTVTTSGTAAARYVCTPTLSGLAAGNSLGIELHITSGGTQDDTVSFLAVAFEYTAIE